MAAPMRSILSPFLSRVFISVSTSCVQTSIFQRCSVYTRKILQPALLNQTPFRSLSISCHRWSDTEGEEGTSPKRFKKDYELTEDDVDNGIAYMQSKDYNERYAGKPVWANYRRNFKGQVPPLKTRKSCFRGQQRAAHPCPVCRDERLVLSHRNIKLLEQFVAQSTWKVYSASQTGLCQKAQKTLEREIRKSQEHGLMPFTVPYVKYDYNEFYPDAKSTQQQSSASS